MKMKNSWVIFVLSCWFLAACNSYTPYPRPYGYVRIDLPVQTTYTDFQAETCPLAFEFPDHGVVTRDLADSCWVDISFPQFDCRWHISYRDVAKTGKTKNTIFEDYRELLYNHTMKASKIDDVPFSIPAGEGVRFDMYGKCSHAYTVLPI